MSEIITFSYYIYIFKVHSSHNKYAKVYIKILTSTYRGQGSAFLDHVVSCKTIDGKKIRLIQRITGCLSYQVYHCFTIAKDNLANTKLNCKRQIANIKLRNMKKDLVFQAKL